MLVCRLLEAMARHEGIQQLSEEGAVRLGRGFLRLTDKNGVSARKGVAVHERHSLTAWNFAPPQE